MKSGAWPRRGRASIRRAFEASPSLGRALEGIQCEGEAIFFASLSSPSWRQIKDFIFPSASFLKITVAYKARMKKVVSDSGVRTDEGVPSALSTKWSFTFRTVRENQGNISYLPVYWSRSLASIAT